MSRVLMVASLAALVAGCSQISHKQEVRLCSTWKDVLSADRLGEDANEALQTANSSVVDANSRVIKVVKDRGGDTAAAELANNQARQAASLTRDRLQDAEQADAQAQSERDAVCSGISQ